MGRISKDEWQWQVGGKQQSARVFPSTRRVIWSGWIETNDVPLFEDGIRQTFEAVLNEPPPVKMPDDLLAELRAYLRSL